VGLESFRQAVSNLVIFGIELCQGAIKILLIANTRRSQFDQCRDCSVQITAG